jgi:hypothetical protein
MSNGPDCRHDEDQEQPHVAADGPAAHRPYCEELSVSRSLLGVIQGCFREYVGLLLRTCEELFPVLDVEAQHRQYHAKDKNMEVTERVKLEDDNEVVDGAAQLA